MACKVVFLDIDGVLTSARAHCGLLPKHLQGIVWHNFDPVAIGFLNRLVEETPGLQFVLSSSWRHSFNQQTMTMMLSQAGWLGEWHSNWKTLGGKNRGEEIQQWIDIHKPDRYVILDDDTSIKDALHWVQTNPEDGMNSLSHFVKAKEVLKHKCI